MKQVTLNVQKEYECDVLVCGGGVSGFAAAVSAARNGAKTMLIESGGFLGGTATKGLVAPFMTCYDAEGKERIIKGLYSKLEERLLKENGGIAPEKCPGGDSYSGYRTKGHIGVMPFDTEIIKIVFEQMCLEAGVEILYHTNLLGCDREEKNITKVYAADSNDIISISAKMFIDTTGTAALAYKAGAQIMRGNDDGMLQTSSMFFVISGVNKQVLDEYMNKNEEMRARYFMDAIEQGKKDGTFPCGTRKLRIFENPNGTFTVNMAQIDEQINELDNEEITKGEISQRLQIQKIVEFMRKNIPGLENAELFATASDLGIRESRRIVGKTLFCLDDIQQAKKFDDRIAVCANSIDMHQKDRVSYTAHTGKNYYIPLSCLISNSVDNLLTAGKSLSADKYAFAAVRVMPPCIAMGEAAGITAALAAQKSVAAGDVPHEEVQKILIDNGAFLG
ncbi:MAG: FAD-dependent oxidoreductase [Ruminococcaceae bacterium]|nr:FAD-dependent oxidoreductase [Oscillospiraceae bacterium]